MLRRTHIHICSPMQRCRKLPRLPLLHVQRAPDADGHVTCCEEPPHRETEAESEGAGRCVRAPRGLEAREPAVPVDEVRKAGSNTCWFGCFICGWYCLPDIHRWCRRLGQDFAPHQLETDLGRKSAFVVSRSFFWPIGRIVHGLQKWGVKQEVVDL